MTFTSEDEEMSSNSFVPTNAISSPSGDIASNVGSAIDRALGAKNLEVKLGSNDLLDVRQFSVHERLSTLFEVHLVAVSENPSIDFDAVVGQPAKFSIAAGVHDKFWAGVCNHFRQIRVEPSGVSTYEISIVPTLWLLTQRKNHRMFQQISEPDIVLKLLDEWHIEAQLRIDKRAYKKRKYRVQYGETDFTFMCRMLEDAGITFCFEQDGEETKLVLADAPQSNETRTKPLTFVDDTSLVKNVALEFVTGVQVGQRVRPGKYTMRDHDYRKPPTYQPMSTAVKGLAIEEKLERFQYAPGAFLFGAAAGEATPSADDKGKTRTDEKEAATLVQKRLDAQRGSARLIAFDTNAHDLVPGVVMTIRGYPHVALGDEKTILVVASKLNGTARGEWAHHCEARGTDIPFRPELSTPKPKVNGVESATVVGPQGEEIHTDEFGRVRVHFHWDRESQMDENSSCWIHVSQPWGGAGFGATNLPRIGQEVLVDFLGGNPDRPVIVGRVYTNLQKTPYKLPESKTQSGWKSNSTGGGGGYNEIMFEDAAGKELVNIQAEKDLKKLVKNDESVTIGRNRTNLVKSNDSLTVGANRTKRVAQNENASIGMNKTLSVGINRSTQVGSIDSTFVGDTHVVAVSPPGEWGVSEESTSVLMQNQRIVLDTGAGAKIIMEGGIITLEANMIALHAQALLNATSAVMMLDGATNLSVGSSQGMATLNGTASLQLSSGGSMSATAPTIQLNGPGLFAGRVTDLAPDQITHGSATVLIGGPAFPLGVRKMSDGTVQVGDQMVLHGDEAFQTATLGALGQISVTPAGRDLLNALNAAGKPINIHPSTNGNGARPVDVLLAIPDKNGKPGEGTGTDVSFNPNRTQVGDGTEPWHNRPPALGLAHELIHAYHNSTGTNDFTPAGEDMAVGLPPHDTQPFHENRMRSQWNPPQPQRTQY